MTGKQLNVVPKQAVVVVHGMGEQRPLETLREFGGSSSVPSICCSSMSWSPASPGFSP